MRTSEFLREGIAAATIARMEQNGEVLRLGRGLWQLSDAEVETGHTLAEIAKLIPKGIICLTSALSYHDLTDKLPREIFVAIDRKDWRPRVHGVRVMRFSPKAMQVGVEDLVIEGVTVRITSPAKTVVDMFRYRGTLGIDLALEGLKACLRQRKATPSEIARTAADLGVLRVIQPYMEALSV